MQQRREVDRGTNTNSGAVVETNDYDVDARLITRSVVSGHGTNTVLSDVLGHDARGKVTHATVSSSFNTGVADDATMAYDGLGALAGMWRIRGSGSLDWYTSDALGNSLGHTSWADYQSKFGYTYGGDQVGQIGRAPDRIGMVPDGAGAPNNQNIDTTLHSYDDSGNLQATSVRVWKWIGTTYDAFGQIVDAYTWNFVGPTWTWNAYGADEKMRVSQRTSFETSGRRTVFMEYRYDALGRRVLMRTRVDSLCQVLQPSDCKQSIDRFVWDGDQLLYELRADGGYSLYGSQLEAEYNPGDPFKGKVRYTHAGGIDEPLAVWKNGTGTVPHRSWRGFYEAGSAMDGSTATGITWPALYTDAFYAKDARMNPVPPTAWLGSIIEGKAEPNGLMYMRNRYYDPKSGRFTQEDPIGLGGGLNLYGFAGGDPVTYSDPFGLCPGPDGKDDGKPCPHVVTLSLGAAAAYFVGGNVNAGVAFSSDGMRLFANAGPSFGMGLSVTKAQGGVEQGTLENYGSKDEVAFSGAGSPTVSTPLFGGSQIRTEYLNTDNGQLETRRTGYSLSFGPGAGLFFNYTNQQVGSRIIPWVAPPAPGNVMCVKAGIGCATSNGSPPK